jgi:D-hydroxyproline dehydrogenase subunit beta
MTIQHADVAVVGAGIVGLAHALALAKRGHKVVLFERTDPAVGASIRNFGQVWPVGKTGALFARAMKSREIWLEVSKGANFFCRENGSLHLAYHADEMAVLEDIYAAVPELKTHGALLTPAQTAEKSAAVKLDGLRGALWSDTELNVDPRQAIRAIPGWLAQTYGVQLQFSTLVTRIDLPHIHTTAGMWQVEQVYVCSGADFETLYPAEYTAAGFTRCKLQMLRTKSQPEDWTLGPNLCAGLSLVQYKRTFGHLPSWAALNARMQAEMPFYLEWGIHLLVSQTAKGEVTIGDSHEYGLTFDPFDREDLNTAIMDYLHTFAQLPTFEIAELWHGIYPLVNGKREIVLNPAPGVTIVNGLGGSGMTLSFGLAEEVVSNTYIPDL